MKFEVTTCLLLASVTLTWAQTSDLQTWTSSDGRIIQAKFVRYETNAVVIEKDGVAFTVPLVKLSPASMVQARKMGEAAAAKAPHAPVVHDAVLHGTIATAPEGAPEPVTRAISAGNTLQTKGYKVGGGRDTLEDTGYDCSGAVSYMLIKAGLLDEPRTSQTFATFGDPGPGKWITIHTRPGHVFITLCGLRLDTGGRGGIGPAGPRWSTFLRGGPEWTERHPPGL
ncbi:MAG: hypothetical protein K1X78_10905 [Verrucomicrobiaceae bacterium]|nr:hypothetical protein [Verrucomicrobiaceae bacterium]